MGLAETQKLYAFPRAVSSGGLSVSRFGSSTKQEWVQWSEFELWGRQGSGWALSAAGSWRDIVPREAFEMSKSNGALPAVRTAGVQPVSGGLREPRLNQR